MGAGDLFGAGDFFGGGSLTPFLFCTNLLVRVKLGYPPNLNFLGKPLLGEKYMEGKKKKNNAKFSGHYVCPRMQNVRAHALRSHQFMGLELWARESISDPLPSSYSPFLHPFIICAFQNLMYVILETS